MSPCIEYTPGLHVCRSHGTIRPVPRRRRKCWWCFACRQRLLHTLMMFEPERGSPYEANFWWECEGCHEEHVLFPGREWLEKE